MPKRSKNKNSSYQKSDESLLHSKSNAQPSMQQCTWTLNQYVSYTTAAATTYGDPYSENYSVIAGPDGFGILPQLGTEQQYLYGASSGQFANLALLYDTYRLEKVKLTVIPTAMQGLGGISPMLHNIDVTGTRDDPLTSVGDYERARTAQITPAWQGCSRTIDYATWLQQNVEKPYLLTIDASGNREEYQNVVPPGVSAEKRLPAANIAFRVYNLTTKPVVTFTVFVQVTYRFRGRRCDLNPFMASSALLHQWPDFQDFVNTKAMCIVEKSSKLSKDESSIMRALLLKAGDVESNPGPVTDLSDDDEG